MPAAQSVPKLEHFERAQRHHHDRRLHLQLGALALRLPVHLRSRLLRHRDAQLRLRALRRRPLRHGGLPAHAAPVRPHDRRRHRQREDGAGAQAPLRPDVRAQVGHQHGRLRQQRRAVLRRLQRRQRRRQDRAGRRLHPGLPAAPRGALPGAAGAAGQDPAAQVRRRDPKRPP